MDCHPNKQEQIIKKSFKNNFKDEKTADLNSKFAQKTQKQELKQPKSTISEKISQKQVKYFNNTHITGINYKRYEKPDYGDKISPLGLSKEQSIEFLENLPKGLKNSYFAQGIRKKWGL